MKPENTPHRQAYMRNFNALRKACWREKGLCTRCGRQPTPGYRTCEKCREQVKAAKAAWKERLTLPEKQAIAKRHRSAYQKRRRLGLCGKCGGVPDTRVLRVTGETVHNALCALCREKAYKRIKEREA